MYVTIDLRYIDIWKLITLSIQVAELMAAMAKNPELSYCKIVEVIAETTAPLTPAEKLLAKIPSQRPYIPSPKVSTFVYNTFCDVYFELIENFVRFIFEKEGLLSIEFNSSCLVVQHSC